MACQLALKNTASLIALVGVCTAAPLSAQQSADGPVFDLGTLTLEARRRAEDTLDVPVSGSIVSNAEIEAGRLDDLEDLSRTVPGLEQPNFGDDPRTAQPIIRGVGPLSTLLSPDNATTSVIIDGVPFPAFAGSNQLLDIGQVEVLRGPQGTLFGRNTTGGAIVIRETDPDGTRERRLNVEVGTDRYRKLEFTGGGRLSDTVNGRLAFRLTEQDGYIKNDHPGEKPIGGYDIGALRAALKWSPSSATEVTFSFGKEIDKRDTGYPVLLRDADAFQETPRFERDLTSGTVNLTHRFNRMEFHSVTGIVDYDIDNTTDNTDGNFFGLLFGLPATNFINDGEFNVSAQEERQFYQEFRLQSLDSAPISWVVGATFSRNEYLENTTGNSSFFATVNGTRRVELDSTSQAIFGDIAVPFADRFEFGAGLRYTHEEKSIDQDFTGNGFAGTVANFSQESTRDFDLLTGRVSLSYKPNDTSLVYGSISRGAKAGGFPRFTNNASFGTPEDGYDETTIWAAEVGVKSEVLQGAGLISLAAFYGDVTDEAIFTSDPVTNTFPIENFDTRSYGIEAEGQFELENGFDLRLGATLTNSEITGTQPGTLFPDAVGNDVPNVPQFSGSIAVAYETSAAFLGLSGAKLNTSLAWRHVGKRSVDANNSFDLDVQNVIDARLAITSGNTEYYLFAENLLDEQLEQQGVLVGTAQSVVKSRGRTIGFGVTTRF